MTKKLLILVALVAINFQTTSCTSSKSQDETGVVENADVEKIEAEDNLAANTDAVPAESDASMQAALGEAAPPDVQNLDVPTDTAKVDSALPADAPPANVAAAPTLDETSLDAPPAELPPVDTTIANEPPPPAMDSPSTELPPPVTAMNEPSPQVESQAPTESAPAIENSGTNTAMNDSPAPFKRAKSSFVANGGGGLKKISATVPYKTAGGWVNTVYVARPGETIKDISQKIFASDKTKQLKKIAENSYLKSRSVKAGDKIYYVSPNRPDDSGKTLMYYEDMGIVPETYVAKQGDSLKKVAKQILGYDKGYIEMWTSNPVESKTKLNEGETIRYWKSASGVTSEQASMAAPTGNKNSAQLVDPGQAPQPQAQATTAAPPPAEMPMPPAPDSATLPPPPGQTVAANTAPPQPEATLPPPPDATASLPPPPPPPPTEMAPPPPVDDMAAANQGAKKKKPTGAEDEAAGGIGGIDNDTLMSLGAVGVLTAMLAFVLIRRKKKKAAEQAAMSNEMNIG